MSSLVHEATQLYARAGGAGSSDADGHGDGHHSTHPAFVIPFVSLLFGIAIFPLINAHKWEHYYPLYTLMCAVAFFVPYAIISSFDIALRDFFHALTAEYLPFMALISALYIAAGGVVIRSSYAGTPLSNTLVLLCASPMSSFLGTTGASMVMIRPFLRSIQHRRYKQHSVIAFIMIVSNISGALTPIGDPPVFMLFLKGVDFFWPLRFLAAPTAMALVLTLLAYFGIDTLLYKREQKMGPLSAGSAEEGTAMKSDDKTAVDEKSEKKALGDDNSSLGGKSSSTHVDEGVQVTPSLKENRVPRNKVEGLVMGLRNSVLGWWNVLILILVSVTVVVTGSVEKSESIWDGFANHVSEQNDVSQYGIYLLPETSYASIDPKIGPHEVFIPWTSFARVLIMFALAALSLKITPASYRKMNEFTWEPVREVAILFAGIFLVLVPVFSILRENEKTLQDIFNSEQIYFWVTGILSGFLDNTPTALLAYQIGGGGQGAVYMMAERTGVLSALLGASVYFGALTYIGNAPNLLVRSIAEEQGIPMPSFLGYFARALILFPIFALVSVAFFL